MGAKKTRLESPEQSERSGSTGPRVACATSRPVPAVPHDFGHDGPQPEEGEADRRARVARAIRDQRDEIIRHREAMVRRLGRIVTLDEAAREWIPAHAAEWRLRALGNPPLADSRTDPGM